MHKEFGKLPLGPGKELRCFIETWKGRDYAHARQFYDNAGTMTPGKGLGVLVQDLPWLHAQLGVMMGEAIRAGLVEPEDFTNHDLPLPPELAGPKLAA